MKGPKKTFDQISCDSDHWREIIKWAIPAREHEGDTDKGECWIEGGWINTVCKILKAKFPLNT